MFVLSIILYLRDGYPASLMSICVWTGCFQRTDTAARHARPQKGPHIQFCRRIGSKVWPFCCLLQEFPRLDIRSPLSNCLTVAHFNSGSIVVSPMSSCNTATVSLYHMSYVRIEPGTVRVPNRQEVTVEAIVLRQSMKCWWLLLLRVCSVGWSRSEILPTQLAWIESLVGIVGNTFHIPNNDWLSVCISQINDRGSFPPCIPDPSRSIYPFASTGTDSDFLLSHITCIQTLAQFRLTTDNILFFSGIRPG